jgi:Domain of unknown function (DUF4388)
MEEQHDEIPDSAGETDGGRRGGRVTAELWVSAGGRAQPGVKRRGDLGATGVYVLTDEAAGSPGDVVPLTLESADRTETFSTLARVARVLRQDDRLRGSRIIGIAYEFLPLDRVQPGAAKLLKRVTTLAFSKLGQLRLDRAAPAFITAGTGAREKAKLRMFGVEHVALYTSRALPFRQAVAVELPRSAESLHLRGEVVSSTQELEAGKPRFLNIVHLSDASESQAAELLAFAQELLVPVTSEPEERSYYDFRGELGTLRVTDILGLLHQERYSGVLSAGDAQRFFSVEVSEGRIGSIEPGGATLGDLTSLAEGEFQFKNRRLAQLSALTGTTGRLVRDVFEGRSPD